MVTDLLRDIVYNTDKYEDNHEARMDTILQPMSGGSFFRFHFKFNIQD